MGDTISQTIYTISKHQKHSIQVTDKRRCIECCHWFPVVEMILARDLWFCKLCARKVAGL